jgi:hypothetical protein
MNKNINSQQIAKPLSLELNDFPGELSVYQQMFNLSGLNVNDLKEYQKNYVYKFLWIYNQTFNLKGNELRKYLNKLRKTYGKKVWSYPQFARLVKLFKKYGILAIIPHWGKNLEIVDVSDNLFEVFAAKHLQTGGADSLTCWLETLQSVLSKDSTIGFNDFPSLNSFLHKLKKVNPDKILQYLENRSSYNSRNESDIAKLSRLKKDNSVDLFQKDCLTHYNIDIDPFVITRLSSYEWLYVFEWMNLLLGTIEMNTAELDCFCKNFKSRNNFKFLTSEMIIEKRKTFKLLIECKLQSIHNVFRPD